jgi:lipopolysaccharide biosynthesis glycosyltransferase
MNQPKLYLCYSINDFYAREAGISMLGFLENNPGYEPEEVFVLDYGILPANRQRLNEVASRYGRRITYLDARPVTSAVKREFPHLKGWRGTMAPNAKCFVDQIFPGYVERLLFIDADTVVTGSVAELQRMDMGDAALGIVPGIINSERICFNSGVLLFNLPAWRRKGCHEMIISTLQKKIHLELPDQDLLNYAIPQRLLKLLPPKYNYSMHFFHPRQERIRMHKGNICTEEEIEEAIRQPAIIHYLAGWIMARPWHEGCHSRRAADYYHYKALSPWKDEQLLGPYGGVLAPHGVRQHIEYWHIQFYATCPSYRLAQLTKTCSKAIIKVLDKIRGNKVTQ